MPRHDGATFTEADVPLDGQEFHHCTFKSCRLIYSGGAPPVLSGNKFLAGCQIEFDGAAARTLAVFKAMYHGGFKPVIENTIAEIRKP